MTWKQPTIATDASMASPSHPTRTFHSIPCASTHGAMGLCRRWNDMYKKKTHLNNGEATACGQKLGKLPHTSDVELVDCVNCQHTDVYAELKWPKEIKLLKEIDEQPITKEDMDGSSWHHTLGVILQKLESLQPSDKALEDAYQQGYTKGNNDHLRWVQKQLGLDE